MATARHATVVAAQRIGPDTRLLELASDEPLGFVGGQYVIVDTGQTLPSGKACKRAYSILSADHEQHRFRLAAKRIHGGPASSFLHLVEPGTVVKFSGPWGKLVPAPDAGGRTLVLATDTGITAALGLVQGTRFRALAPATTFLWLQPTPGEFLPERLVGELLPRDLGAVRFEAIAPIGAPLRIPQVRARLAEVLAAGRLGQAFIAGDGAVNYALLDDLVAAGVAATRDSVESFFNMPKKSA